MAGRSACIIEGCLSPRHTAGLCDKHRYRQQKYGDPLHVCARKPLAKCTVDGCGMRNSSGGLCATHLYRFKRYGDPLIKKLWPRKSCTVAGCKSLAANKGLCGKHHMRKKTWGDPLGARKRNVCCVTGCQTFSHTDGMCKTHLYRQRRYGNPLIVRQIQGAGTLCGGYRVIACPDPMHPNAMSNGRILEHVWVMVKKLGRPLLPKENIHHKNGQRADNREENLELWSTKQPPGQRISDKIAFAKEILRLYEPDALREAVAAE